MDRQLIIVDNKEKLQAMLDHIEKYDVLAFDTETTGLIPVRDKVIGFSICGEVGEAYYLPHLTWDANYGKLIEVHSFEDTKKYIELLLDKELLMFNGSFDVRFVKGFFGVDLVESLVADVMLLKHTCEEEGFFGLKPTAIQYQAEIGLDVETEANQEQIDLKANVKKNGGTTTRAKYEMYKADLDVMGPYAAADADLTLRLGLYFRDRLEAEGQELVDFFYDDEVMPLYKYVTIPMESKPVLLDIPLIESYRDKIVVDMEKLHKEVLEELLAEEGVQKWLAEVSEELYPSSNKGSFAQKVAERFNLALPLSPSGKYKMGKKFLEDLPESPAREFLLGRGDGSLKQPIRATKLAKKMYPDYKETDGYLTVINSTDISIELWEKKNGGKINISSKPQMGKIVTDYLGVKPLSKTPSGKPQFDDAMIQHLEDKGYEWARKLGNFNKLTKIKSAYMDRFLDNHVDGGYYFYYKQHGTLSGRFSSDAQQLPRPKEEGELDPLVLEYNNAIRAFFIAGEGRKFADLDYESLEPHVFSHVSGDEGLRDIFRKGHDFYSTIAIATENLEGISADKKAENYLGKVNKPLRQSAKAYSLGVPYGMSPYALAKTLEIEEKEAQKKYDGYLNGFPELKKWMDRSKHDAQYKGFVSTQTGRVRHLGKVKDIHKKHGEKILDFKYRNKLIRKGTLKVGKEEANKVVKGMYLDYKNGINNARNFQIQGLSASIVNRSMIRIAKMIKARKIDAWICGTVHDQIIVNVPDGIAEKMAREIEKIMCSTG